MSVIKLIWTWFTNAKTASKLASEYTSITWNKISERDVRKAIKNNRELGIIWNHKWSYIETNKENINAFINKRVIPSMYGYVKWMNNIWDKLWCSINLNIN